MPTLRAGVFERPGLPHLGNENPIYAGSPGDGLDGLHPIERPGQGRTRLLGRPSGVVS